MNQIAGSYPRNTFDTLAYQETARPPAMVRPLANVQIRYCPIDACQSHAFDACRPNRTIQEQLAQWRQIAQHVIVWQYSTNFSHFLLPFPNESGLIADLRQFQREGIAGVFVEGAVSDGGGAENAELRAYLAARLLWDPEIRVDAEIQGFIEAVYGPSAPWMRRYYALRLGNKADHLWIDQNVDAPYLTDRFLKEGRELLNRAREHAATDAQQKRIDRAILPLDYVGMMRGRRFYLSSAAYAPRDLQVSQRMTQEFVRKAEASGVTHLREGYPLVKQARDFEELMREYSVLTLADGKITVKIVPQLDARIVAMGSSEVLRVTDPGEWGYPNVSGLYCGLRSHRIAWQVESTTLSVLALKGQSDHGLDANMTIALRDGALRVRAKISNPTGKTLPADASLRAELRASRDVKLLGQTLESDSGRVEIPAEGCTLHSVTVLPKGALRGQVQWSFLGNSRLDVQLASPDASLAPGQETVLECDYVLS